MTGPWDKIRKHETDEKPLRDNGTAGSSSGGLDHAARDYNAMLQRTAVGSLSGDASLQGEGMHFNSLTAHEEGEDEISSEEPQGRSPQLNELNVLAVSYGVCGRVVLSQTATFCVRTFNSRRPRRPRSMVIFHEFGNEVAS